MRQHIIPVLILLTVSLSANAQRKYMTNGAFDNLFLEVGGGVNGVLDNGTYDLTSPSFSASFGKWFTPSAGMAVGYTGFTNKSAESANGWFSGDNAFRYNYIHADFRWNFINTIFGYKEKRIVTSSLNGIAGLVIAKSGTTTITELAAGAGLTLSFRLTSWLSLQGYGSIAFAREEAFRPDAGSAIAFTSLGGGVVVNFGAKTNKWEPYKIETKEVKVYVQKPCDHAELIARLQAERDSLLACAPKEVKVDHYIHDGHVVYFVIDKWDILERENFHLMDLVASLPEGASLRLVGHADKETGSAKRNEKLSRNRVSVIAERLRALGFKGTIHTDWKGDTANPFDGLPPKNRCVTIQVDL